MYCIRSFKKSKEKQIRVDENFRAVRQNPAFYPFILIGAGCRPGPPPFARGGSFADCPVRNYWPFSFLRETVLGNGYVTVPSGANRPR